MWLELELESGYHFSICNRKMEVTPLIPNRAFRRGCSLKIMKVLGPIFILITTEGFS